jgi:release factor H-coupled RctB family protein
MGTPDLNAVASRMDAADIHSFYSPQSWIEGSALEQLKQVASLQGMQKLAAFPDLHPGKYGPVGCAMLSSNLHPQLIGNDIGCGMSLFALDLPSRKIKIDKAASQLAKLNQTASNDAKQNTDHLETNGLSATLHPDTLGTIGGGNHFCELQMIDQIENSDLATKAGLDRSQSYLLVHSGSRSFGTEVFASILQNSVLTDTEADTYLALHDQAVRWAKLNRQVIAERTATLLRCDCRLISDSPHNLVEIVENIDGSRSFLHRKGAAKADMAFVPLAGSRDALSYLVHPTGRNNEALTSLAHGAGRKYNRSSMHGRISRNKSVQESLERTSFGGRVICEDSQLLIEEAPHAYKDASHVLKDLTDLHLVEPVASFKPLVTFKKSSTGSSSNKSRNSKQWRHKR